MQNFIWVDSKVVQDSNLPLTSSVTSWLNLFASLHCGKWPDCSNQIKRFSDWRVTIKRYSRKMTYEDAATLDEFWELG